MDHKRMTGGEDEPEEKKKTDDEPFPEADGDDGQFDHLERSDANNDTLEKIKKLEEILKQNDENERAGQNREAARTLAENQLKLRISRMESEKSQSLGVVDPRNMKQSMGGGEILRMIL